jgi:predicted esterase
MQRLFVFLFTFTLFLMGCSSPSLNTPQTKVDSDNLNSSGGEIFVFFHGSGGPSEKSRRRALKYSSGAETINFCWYNCENELADSLDPLVAIDLKKVSENLNQVLSTIKLEHRKLVFMGISRGAEIASLLVSYAEEVGIRYTPDVLILISGTDRVAPGRISSDKKALYRRIMAPSLKKDLNTVFHTPAWTIGSRPILTGSQIPLEKFQGSVLLIHGDQDKIWSPRYSENLQTRLKRSGRNATLIKLEMEGHVMSRLGQETIKSEVHNFIK